MREQSGQDSELPSVPLPHRLLCSRPPDDTVACSCRGDGETCSSTRAVEEESLADTTGHEGLGLLVLWGHHLTEEWKEEKKSNFNEVAEN